MTQVNAPKTSEISKKEEEKYIYKKKKTIADTAVHVFRWKFTFDTHRKESKNLHVDTSQQNVIQHLNKKTHSSAEEL